jgi:hypothetical protein
MHIEIEIGTRTNQQESHPILPKRVYDPIMYEDYIRQEMTFALCPHVNRRKRQCQRCLTRIFNGEEVMPECKERAQAAADTSISALRTLDA